MFCTLQNCIVIHIFKLISLAVYLHAYSAQRTRHTLVQTPGKAARQTRAVQTLLHMQPSATHITSVYFSSLNSCSDKTKSRRQQISGLCRKSSCFRLCSSQRHHPPYASYCSPSLLSLECSAIVSPISLPFCCESSVLSSPVRGPSSRNLGTQYSTRQSEESTRNATAARDPAVILLPHNHATYGGPG